MADNHNVTEMATLLAAVMSEDLDEEVRAADVLDWLASAGLTLRQDEGDAAIAYQLALEDEIERRGGQ
ncbi:MAG: hypothetical protein KDB35_01845 [Acidimicrobiales bacterium]|nr:hypothetical protein [Acidimicrobiales bacterium]